MKMEIERLMMMELEKKYSESPRIAAPRCHFEILLRCFYT